MTTNNVNSGSAPPANDGCGTSDGACCRPHYLGQRDALDWVEEPGGDIAAAEGLIFGVFDFLNGRSDALPPLPESLRARFHSRLAAGELHLSDEGCWSAGVGFGLTTIVGDIAEVAEAMGLDSTPNQPSHPK